MTLRAPALLAALSVSALFAGACASESDAPVASPSRQAGEREDVALPDVGGERFFLVTRPDLKKCMWPMCGGHYVRAVNQEVTACLGGASEPDCYVASFDYAALGLDDEGKVLLDQAVKSGRAIVRGSFSTVEGPFAKVATLTVSEGWVAQSPDAEPELEAPNFSFPPPAGDFYGIQGTGIVCITYPCPTVSETKLNTLASDALAGLDLSPTGASDEVIEAAGAALDGGRILVAGTHQTVVGPAGQGKQLVASELYLPAMSSSASGKACGLNTCGADQECCNASCGICVPKGGACIQLACSCGHGECEKGEALDAQCSSCTSMVCGADPYCCDTAWDSICVGEAEEMCGGVCAEPELEPEPEPEPEPTCEHSTCEAGVALDADCSDCAGTVCAQDAFCCDVKWDALCVTQADDLCGACEAEPAACAHSVCLEGPALTDACSSCAALVCGQDPFCCDVEWDGLCVDQADACGVCD